MVGLTLVGLRGKELKQCAWPRSGWKKADPVRVEVPQ